MFTKRNERVAEEAAALAGARHPGVVDLVDVVDGALRTRLVEGRAVAELPPLPAEEVAGLAAAVATTLADLHDLGQVHGGIDATHVLVGYDGRPLLCSLGRGGDPADDVAALGRLIAAQLAAAPAEDRGRRRRLGRRRLGPLLAPPAGPTLAALAVEATAPDPADRPSARVLAEAIGRRVPAARLPRPAPAPFPNLVRNPAPGRRIPRQVPPAPPVCAPPNPVQDLPAPRRRGWRSGVPARMATITSVVGCVVLLGTLSVLTPAGSRLLSRNLPAGTNSPAADPTHAPAVPGTTTVSPPPTTRLAERVWPTDPLDFRDGALVYGGARYALGQSGDALVAGDWRCTGRPTLALLRRGAGEVFAFDSWPVGATTVVARSLGRVEGATSLRAVDVDGDGCQELEVERAGAAPVRLRVAS